MRLICWVFSKLNFFVDVLKLDFFIIESFATWIIQIILLSLRLILKIQFYLLLVASRCQLVFVFTFAKIVEPALTSERSFIEILLGLSLWAIIKVI